MDTIVGDVMGSEEIVRVSKVNEGVVLHSGPGEDRPENEPKEEDRDGKTIKPAD
jgi:hypothetical protein